MSFPPSFTLSKQTPRKGGERATQSKWKENILFSTVHKSTPCPFFFSLQAWQCQAREVVTRMKRIKHIDIDTTNERQKPVQIPEIGKNLLDCTLDLILIQLCLPIFRYNWAILRFSFAKSTKWDAKQYVFYLVWAVKSLTLFFCQVSWIRKRDSHILTVGSSTFISDGRFYILKPEKRHVWTLRIR